MNQSDLGRGLRRTENTILNKRSDKALWEVTLQYEQKYSPPKYYLFWCFSIEKHVSLSLCKNVVYIGTLIGSRKTLPHKEKSMGLRMGLGPCRSEWKMTVHFLPQLPNNTGWRQEEMQRFWGIIQRVYWGNCDMLDSKKRVHSIAFLFLL